MTAFCTDFGFTALGVVSTVSTDRRYPSTRGALVADVGRFVCFGGEAELLSLDQAAQVGEVTRDDEEREDGDDEDVARLVPRERDADRERDRDGDRRDGGLVRDLGEY